MVTVELCLNNTLITYVHREQAAGGADMFEQQVRAHEYGCCRGALVIHVETCANVCCVINCILLFLFCISGIAVFAHRICRRPLRLRNHVFLL